jgi:hypothetical protein
MPCPDFSEPHGLPLTCHRCCQPSQVSDGKSTLTKGPDCNRGLSAWEERRCPLMAWLIDE